MGVCLGGGCFKGGGECGKEIFTGDGGNFGEGL